MKLLITLIVLLFCSAVSAQVFPVHVSTRITPPYSPYLSDYTTPGSQNFAITIHTNDVTLADYPCKLRITIEGPGITLRTKPTFASSPILLQGGVPQTLYGEDVHEYLHPDNLHMSALTGYDFGRTSKLPEGIYRFTVEVLDYNRGTAVSNKGMTTAWIILNDPPILISPANFSRLTLQEQVNILFTWTPRHTGSPNAAFSTEYTFRLVELWSDHINPNDAFLTQQPLFEANTSQNQFHFDQTGPQLLPGRKYAWQVQAHEPGGKDLFRNNGRSEVHVFQYGEPLAIPANLRMRWAKPTTLAVQWDAVRRDDGEVRYRLQYRPRLRRENHEWYETWTRFTDKTIYNLQSNTDYEMRIRTENALQESEYSDTQIFKTLRDDPGAFVCKDNVSPPPLPPNSQPVFPLSVNDTIHAGGYSVLVRDVMKVGSKYFGSGLAIVPWFNGAKVRVTFEDISVNAAFWLTSGTIKSVWNPDGDFIVEEEIPIAPGAAPQAGELDITIVETDSLVTVTGSFIASVTKNESGDIVVTTTDGKEQTIPAGNSVALTDGGGNGYVIDEQGNIAKTTATEATATATRGKRDYDGNIALHFSNAEASFGFDEKKFEGLARYYQQLGDGSYAAWKALSSARPDKITGSLSGGDIGIRALTFEAGNAPIAAVPTSGSEAILSLQGKTAGMEEELLALYKPSDTIPARIVGKVNLATYDPIRYNLEIVPVNGATMPAGVTANAITGDLNKVYSQAVVEWNVVVRENLIVPLEDAFDDGDAGLLSSYTDDMKKVLRAFGSFRDNTYYLFIIQEPRNQATLGYMPRSRQAGFVFAAPHNGDATEFLKTIAHELGHGAFNLQHTFREHNLPAGVTDNLMDYSNGTALYKYQWDYIHEPQTTIGLFEAGEEGASVRSKLISFYESAAPLLDQPDYKSWVEKVKKVYEFLEACHNEQWESYDGYGIIPYCFWRDDDVAPNLHYTNFDLAFTAGLIDGGYSELEGLYKLPDVLRDVSKFPGKVIYTYTLAYWECRTEKLVASYHEYEYVIGELAKMEREGGLWNWVKEQWYEYKDEKTDIEDYFQDCRDADDLREAIDDLYELATNWEEVKILSGQVCNSLASYWESLEASDNQGRYRRGAMIIPAASIVFPAGVGIASKVGRMKALLKAIAETSKDDISRLGQKIREALKIEFAGTARLESKLLDEAEIQKLASTIRLLPGPELPTKIAASFTNSIYKNRKLISSERFFKYHGIHNRTGRKYTWVVRRKYATENELRDGLAIRKDWGVDIKSVTEFEVPPGIWVSEGTAASQGIGYPGGHYQAVILNVPRTWIIKTTDAFRNEK